MVKSSMGSTANSVSRGPIFRVKGLSRVVIRAMMLWCVGELCCTEDASSTARRGSVLLICCCVENIMRCSLVGKILIMKVSSFVAAYLYMLKGYYLHRLTNKSGV